jgi:hypothetical protein
METHLAHQLHDLTEDECWALVASQEVGRIAWSGPGGVTVIPVNFTVDGLAVHLRTAAYSALARECDDSPVAFQVDALDPGDHSGWSVLLHGHAHIDFRGPGPTDPPDVWASGSRSLNLRVVVDRLSGRRLG